MYKVFNNRSELTKHTLSEGEIILYCGKLCQVSLHRKGTLDKVRNVVELNPVKYVTVSEETEVIDNL